MLLLRAHQKGRCVRAISVPLACPQLLLLCTFSNLEGWLQHWQNLGCWLWGAWSSLRKNYRCLKYGNASQSCYLVTQQSMTQQSLPYLASLPVYAQLVCVAGSIHHAWQHSCSRHNVHHQIPHSNICKGPHPQPSPATRPRAACPSNSMHGSHRGEASI